MATAIETPETTSERRALALLRMDRDAFHALVQAGHVGYIGPIGKSHRKYFLADILAIRDAAMRPATVPPPAPTSAA